MVVTESEANKPALPVGYCVMEIAKRKEIRGTPFSGNEFLRRHHKRIKSLLEQVDGALAGMLEPTLLLRLYLNHALPIDGRHKSGNRLASDFGEFIDEQFSREVVRQLATVTEQDEVIARRLLLEWHSLPNADFRGWWAREQPGSICPIFPRPYFFSPSYLRFLRLAVMLRESAWELGVWGTPEAVVQRLARGQSDSLAGFAQSITVGFALTEKGIARQRAWFNKSYGMGFRRATVNPVAAESFARAEWRLDPWRDDWIMTPRGGDVDGNDQPGASVHVNVLTSRDSAGA